MKCHVRGTRYPFLDSTYRPSTTVLLMLLGLSNMHRTAANFRLRAITQAMSTKTTSPLAPFSACEISDALIKLGSPHGGHIPDIHMLSPSVSESQVKICAPAYTVQMVLASDQAAPKLSAHYVDTATPGSVVVIDAPPRSVCSRCPFYFRTLELTPISMSFLSFPLLFGLPDCTTRLV
jgi:hypothetical protein